MDVTGAPVIFRGRPLRRVANKTIADAIAIGRPEGRDIEFKREVDLSTPSTRDQNTLELLKDIAAFANADGGYLLIGVAEKTGRAAGYFKVLEPQRLVQRIRSLCTRHLAPPIRKLEVVQKRPDGNVIVAVRIPPSQDTPHMVTFNDGTSFTIRDEAGKRAMTYEEIRRRFEDRDVFAAVPQLLRVIKDYNKLTRKSVASKAPVRRGRK